MAASRIAPAAATADHPQRGAESAARRGVDDVLAIIWPIADLLRGDYKPAEYGKVIPRWSCFAASIAFSSPLRMPC